MSDPDDPARVGGAGESGDDPLVQIALHAKHFDGRARHELTRWFADEDPRIRDAAARAFELYQPHRDEWRELVVALTDERYAVDESLSRVPMRVAARAAIATLAADDLADLLEPLLADDVLARDHGRVRAEAILTELEGALAARYERGIEVEASPDDYDDEDRERFPTRPPAPLLQARCDHLASRRDAIGGLARRCGDGYRAHAGWFVASQFTEIHLGEGDAQPFPCALAGFLLPFGMPRARVRDAILALDDPPFGLGYFQHATAGIALHYTFLAGYLVAPAPHERRAIDELVAFVGHTSGERVSDADVATWSSRLAAIVPSGLDSIIEGAAVGRPHSPLASLEGRVALVGRPRVPWRDFVLDVDANTFEPDGVYDDARERALVSLGDALGLGVPRVMLLWGNSD